jgi:hypothetical protein
MMEVEKKRLKFPPLFQRRLPMDMTQSLLAEALESGKEERERKGKIKSLRTITNINLWSTPRF